VTQGSCVDESELQRRLEIARKHNVRVLEDCAQCAGGRYKGKYVGTIGDIGINSFQLSKTITAGEGGAVLRGQLQKLETICYGLRTNARKVREAIADLPGLKLRKSDREESDRSPGLAFFPKPTRPSDSIRQPVLSPDQTASTGRSRCLCRRLDSRLPRWAINQSCQRLAAGAFTVFSAGTALSRSQSSDWKCTTMKATCCPSGWMLIGHSP
jgi:hypothetical protein